MSSEEESLEYPKQHVVACEGCGSTVSVNWYCKNCPGSLCDSCKSSHKTTGLTKRHSVVPRTGTVVRTYGPAKIAEECRIHVGREISTYCNDCKTACCASCLVEMHQRHEMSLIEDKYLAAEKRLNDYAKNLESNTKGKLQDMKKKVRSEKEKASSCTEEVEVDVNTFRNQLKQAIDQNCDSILRNLKKPNSDLDALMTDLDNRIKDCDKDIDMIGARIREGKLSITEYLPPTPDSFIPEISMPNITALKFFPKKEVLELMKNHLGTIESMSTSEQVIASSNISPIPKFEKSLITFKKVTSFNCEIGVSSMVTSGMKTAWVVYFTSDTMYLYDNEGKQLRSQTVQKGSGINDLAIKPSGEIVVSNKDKKVRMVASNGKVCTLIDTAPYTPDGICVAKDGEIVVCMVGDNDSQVAVYSSGGRKCIRKMSFHDTNGKQLITDPYRIVQNSEDLCVVNRYAFPSSVVCVNAKGDVRWVYDGTQTKQDEPFNPHGVSRDKFHNLLITDFYNQCVHYINREGELIQIILTAEQTGLINNWAISTDGESGQVWLGNSCRDVVVAKYMK